MVGLPRSGKTTWARQQPFPIVNPDSLRLAIHGEAFKKSEEGLVWWTARKMVEALFIAGHARVILDATNVKKATRDNWKSDMWDVYYKPILTPLDTCLHRAAEVEFPVDVIYRMHEELEPLDDEEREYIWHG